MFRILRVKHSLGLITVQSCIGLVDRSNDPLHFTTKRQVATGGYTVGRRYVTKERIARPTVRDINKHIAANDDEMKTVMSGTDSR